MVREKGEGAGERKKEGRARASSPQILVPFYFHVRALSIPADLTISDPGANYGCFNNVL